MRALRTFRNGGISVDRCRDWAQPSPAPSAFLPNEAVVPLRQHAGDSARCVVRKGEYVREGAVIGRADKPLSANVHAPVPGIVRDIRSIPMPDGDSAEAVFIALEGAFDRLGRRGERYLWKSMLRSDILISLKDRGVIETAAPGVPLYDLIAKRQEPALLILNAVESEPYLRSERSLVRDKPAEVMTGFEILRSVLKPGKAVLAIDDPELAEFVSLPHEGTVLPEIVCLQSRYPQDLPGQLLEAIEGQRRIPQDRVLTLSPTTAFAAYEAIVLAKPFIERYVTVAGAAIKRPSVLKARIGTSVGDLIEECGGFMDPPSRIVVGGVFRGMPVYDLDAPVTKTVSAILALTEREIGDSKRHPCIRCGKCADACPEFLDPDRLYRLADRAKWKEADAEGLGTCTLCGACGFICPSRLPLVAAFASRPVSPFSAIVNREIWA